jgi:hypothetical protein
MQSSRAAWFLFGPESAQNFDSSLIAPVPLQASTLLYTVDIKFEEEKKLGIVEIKFFCWILNLINFCKYKLNGVSFCISDI